MAGAHIEDYSASHGSLAVLLDRTATFLRECGVPTIGSPNALQPPTEDAAAWDLPPTEGQENFYGLWIAPSGFPKRYGEQLPIATAGPTRTVELAELNFNVHRMVPAAAGVLALGSTLRIMYSSPYVTLSEAGYAEFLPAPATCTFVIRNPRVQGWDTREYIIKEVPKHDSLRPEKGIDFDLDGTRADLRDDGIVRLDGMSKVPLMTQREAETLREVVDLLPALPQQNWVRRLEPKQV
jgi:hypothetical protein